MNCQTHFSLRNNSIFKILSINIHIQHAFYELCNICCMYCSAQHMTTALDTVYCPKVSNTIPYFFGLNIAFYAFYALISGAV